MRVMTQADMLALWEAGHALSPLDRAVLTAGAAGCGAGGDPADWPLGQRNRVLATFHCEHFSGLLRGLTRCVHCGEQLEFEFDARAMAEAFPASAQLEIKVGKWIFHLPTSRVLAAAQGDTNASAATRTLLRECMATKEPLNADWSEADMAAIEEQLAAADPLADIRLHFDCPSCAASFDETLDVGAFVWAEIDAFARRTLHEIHTLASAYGWSESEILGLSAARRRVYLEMVLA